MMITTKTSHNRASGARGNPAAIRKPDSRRDAACLLLWEAFQLIDEEEVRAYILTAIKTLAEGEYRAIRNENY
jgi:hypothetical protein